MNKNNLIYNILGYILSYIKSAILAYVVLPTLGTIFFIWTAFSTELEFKWIKYLWFIKPDSTGTLLLDGGDVMKIFGIVSLIFFCVAELLKLTGLKIKLSFKVSAIVLSCIFGFAIYLSFFPTNLLNKITLGKANGFAFIFLVFWINALIAYGILYLLNKVSYLIQKNNPSLK